MVLLLHQARAEVADRVMESEVVQQRKEHTSQATQERLTYCAEAHKLLDAFADAARQVIRIQERQIRAVALGEPDISRFDVLMHYALEGKQKAKYAYLEHLEEHHCS